jgi:hypothetical protein
MAMLLRLRKITKILASNFTVDSLERIDFVGVRLQTILKLLAENFVCIVSREYRERYAICTSAARSLVSVAMKLSEFSAQRPAPRAPLLPFV